MAEIPDSTICQVCRRTMAEGARFGTLSATGKRDDLCVTCRFDEIDAKHSRASDIRDDMRSVGIPIEWLDIYR